MDEKAVQVEAWAKKKGAPKGFSKAQLLYLRHCRKEPVKNADAEAAFDVHESLWQRRIVEALMLSGCPDDVFTEALGLPQEAMDIYRELFFDPSRFRNKLAMIAYLEELPDPEERTLKIMAVNLSYEFVLFKYMSIVPKSEAQDQIVQRLFLSTAYKAMAMNYVSMNSATMKVAIEHAKLMLKAYEALKDLSSDKMETANNLFEVLVKVDSEAKITEQIDGEIG